MKVTRPCCSSTRNDWHAPECARRPKIEVGEFDVYDATALPHLLAKIAEVARLQSDRCFDEGFPHSGVHWSIIERGLRGVCAELKLHNRNQG